MNALSSIKQIIATRYRLMIPLLIILVTVSCAYLLLAEKGNSQQVSRPDKVKFIRSVRVKPLVQKNYQPVWHAAGVVKPMEQVKLLAEVTGQVTALNPAAQPGALLPAGEWLLQVDKRDYELELRNQLAQVVQAEASVDLEQGNQMLAEEEFSLVESAMRADALGLSSQLLEDTALVLRQPQLASARARLDNAQANLEKAQLNLSRTQVTMPFRGKVLARHIGRGSKINPNSALFDIVNVDRFWVEVKIPRAFLVLLDQQAEVDIRQAAVWGKDESRQGRIVSILPDLDDRDRQVRALLSIDDPLALQNPQQPMVFLNDFVDVNLRGETLEQAWEIDSNWLLPDDSIWVVDEQNRLQRRHVDVLFKGRNKTYVRGEFGANPLALAERLDVATSNLVVKPRFLRKKDAPQLAVESKL